ncbi:MAG: ParA family protein [Xanthomonadaceae bacterium]|nr:ParA family protein [Xanthomonadaceae bacterium]
MTTILTLYNHKGGVSKTTTTFNLGHAIAEKYEVKVLLVDADPQCNLTELALSPVIEKLDSEAQKTGKENKLPGSTILDALGPRFAGDRSTVDVDAIELVPINGSDDRVFLFRGDIALSQAEDTLSQAHSMRTSNEIHQKRNYVAFHDMLRRLGAKHGFSHILVDVGPSAGALTRTCFLAADMFVVPVFPDRFNHQAIGSLSKIIAKWVEENSTIVADFQKLGLNVASGCPQFRGLIVQRFQKYRNEPKPAFGHWIKLIPERVKAELLPSLVEATHNKEVVADYCWNDPIIAQIADFASLGPMMLTSGKAVWKLTQGDTGWAGTVWTERSEKMQEFRSLFFDIADKVK